MIRDKINSAWKYLGPAGTAVCVAGGGIMLAPMVITIHNNILWTRVTAYKEKIQRTGVKISYDFCEGNKEYLVKKSASAGGKEIIICTQKSRTRIGEVDYIMGVLGKASGIPAKG